MEVGYLIAKLKKLPQDQDVVLFDYLMNGHNADGEGTPNGIYSKFELEEVELVDMEMNKFKVTAIMFKNEEDYDDDCNKIDK